MSDAANASGTGSGNDGGAGGDKGKGNDSGGGNAPEMVEKSRLDEAVNDMHKFKTRSKESQLQLDSLQTQFDEMKASNAKTDDDYKSLWEGEKTKNTELVDKHERLKGNLYTSERHRAVFPELKKAGLKDEAKGLFDSQDLSEIEVEATTNGRFLVNGVSSYVEKFKALRPYAFETKTAPDFNSDIPGTTSGDGKKHDPDSLFLLEQDCKRKGDMKPWHDAVAQWKKLKAS